MTDHDLQHAANAKALSDMHPGNRFRLMAGLPLLEDEVVTRDIAEQLASAILDAMKADDKRNGYPSQA